MNCMIVRSWKDGALRGAGVLGLLSALAMAPGVQAFPGPLSLNQQNPDITAQNLDIAYTVDGANNMGSLSATNGSGFSLSFTDAGGGTHTTTGTSYDLTLATDASGNFTGPGSLSILGGVADLGIAAGSTLLAGTISDFGVIGASSAGIFEFRVDVTDSAAPLGFGADAGIILTSTNLTPSLGNGTVGFTGTGQANNFSQVPEPSSYALVLIGLLGLVGSRRRPSGA